MRIVIIDNYDSFTYNLRHILRELGAEVDVLRNDKFALADLKDYDKLVLSPGPGIPSDAGLLLDVIREYASTKPILGVCLGEQAIGEAFGAKLMNIPDVCHGVQSQIMIDPHHPDYIFDGLPEKIDVGRYHSWVVEDLPDCLCATAHTIGEHPYVMALKHKTYDVHGIQFHPESVLTPDGKQILQNFLNH